MVRFHTAATIAPSLILLLAVYQLWSVVEELPQFAVFVFLLSLLPMIAQLCLWGYRQSRQDHSGAIMPPHPFGLVLPLALLLIIPLWPVGEWAARQVPAVCETVVYERVLTTRPESSTRNASFSVQAHGWGNARSFGFTGGVIVYTGERRWFEDMYFDLPRRRGHWTNSYTTFFPLTRDVVGDYVRRSDDFPPEEAEAVTGQLWEDLNRYADKRDLPPMFDHFFAGEEPRIVYYVPASTIYLSSCILAVFPLTVGSWILARRYHRQVLHIEGERLPG
jgi:hypothetical protein